MAEREEELKRFLMKLKEESEKAGLKLNIQKTKIMASGPISSVQFSRSVITSWQIDGETVETKWHVLELHIGRTPLLSCHSLCTEPWATLGPESLL